MLLINLKEQTIIICNWQKYKVVIFLYTFARVQTSAPILTFPHWGRELPVIASDSEAIQLIFIVKFMTPLLSFGHPVLDLLHARRVSLFALTCIPLNLLAIRTRFAPSVRKSALPLKGRGKMFLLTY